MSLWVVTSYFNPAGYKSSLKNYYIFADNLKRQGINLLTVELAFNQDDFLLNYDNVFRLRSNSIMWQKERLINYGISQLPNDCLYFAWIDADVLLPDGWIDLAIAEFESGVDILQLFKKVINLPVGKTPNIPFKALSTFQGVIWQKIIHKNWLERRRRKELPFSAPGFAWAARRSVFQTIGLYDRNIVGSGDTFFVDCLLDSWDIHGYAQKFTPKMKSHMEIWRNQLNKQNLMVNYLPIDIHHLYHGTMKDRKYMERHNAILENDYDPAMDVIIKNNVFEWNTDKPKMHNMIKEYFFTRREDTGDTLDTTV